MVGFEDLTEEQQRAATALDRNVTLTAGAGTGKTTTLTERYVQLLEAGIDDGLTPEHVLTTTFTERAANELTESVREALGDRLGDADADEYERWRSVADDLATGYVHTLHAFCARLLREHAVESDRVDPGFDVLEEGDADALAEEAVADLLEDPDSEERHRHAIERLAGLYDRSALVDVLTDMVDERPESREWAEWLLEMDHEEYIDHVRGELHPEPLGEVEALFANAEFRESVTTLREFVESPSGIDTGGRGWGYAADLLDALDGDADDPSPHARLAAVCEALTTSSGERYANYTAVAGRWEHDDDRERFDVALAHVVEHVEPAERDLGASVAADVASYPYLRALAVLTLAALDAYRERTRERNVVDFSGLLAGAVDLLGDDESATERLRERFAYVMVDEVQDTDPRQWDLLEHLTGGFADGNLFVVGDAKQSIYRFRNADVTEFRETEREIGGGSSGGSDELSTNFRSLPGVLAAVNDLFDGIFDADGEAYEAKPQRLTAERDDPAGLASVEYCLVPTDDDLRAARLDPPYDDPALDGVDVAARALAARLTRLFADEPVYKPTPDSDVEESRPARPGDVAILLRTRSNLKTYERALEDANIPYTVAAGLGLHETPEVRGLVNLLRTLADPGDDRALYGTLRSPLFGCTDDTLAELAADDDTDLLWTALADADADRLQDARERLEAWRALAGLGDGTDPKPGWSPSELLARVLDETGYLATVTAGERGRQAAANVEKFRDEVRSLGEETGSLPELVRGLDRRIERDESGGEAEGRDDGDPDGEAERLDDETEDGAVQILTVHDAKGQEYPVVAVPDLSRSYRDRAAVGSGRIEFERVEGQPMAGIKTPSPDDPFDETGTVARERVRERRRAEERAEEKRVLYVACTRARDRLLLTGQHAGAGDGGDDGGGGGDGGGDDGGDGDGIASREPSLTGIDSVNPDDEATSWRELFQPLLVTDDALAALDERDTASVTVGAGTATGEVTLSLPGPAADWSADPAPGDPDLELSEAPPAPGARVRISATDLASLDDGKGCLRHDAATNTVVYDGPDDDDEDEHGDEDGSESADDGSTGSPERTGGLAPTVFGEIVHRLCELRPPAERWADVMEQVHAAEDADAELTEDAVGCVTEHAEKGIAFVDGLVDGPVEHRYDELWVEAEVGDAAVVGYVDCLLVTPDAYHVVDYKTGDVAEADVKETAEHYRTQLAAYALALGEHDPDRDAELHLQFTACDEDWSETLSAAERETTEREVRELIAEHRPSSS